MPACPQPAEFPRTRAAQARGPPPPSFPTSRAWPRTPAACAPGTVSRTPTPRSGPPPPSHPTHRAHLAPSVYAVRAAALQPRERAPPGPERGARPPRGEAAVPPGAVWDASAARRSVLAVCPAASPKIYPVRVTELEMAVRDLETGQDGVCVNKGKTEVVET